jgi:hypothetical protein
MVDPGVDDVPAGQGWHVALVSCPDTLDNVPAGHWLQERVLMAEEKVPMGQDWQDPHEVALYCPGPQFSQSLVPRSTYGRNSPISLILSPLLTESP